MAMPGETKGLLGEPLRLTQHSHGAGCACKIGAEELSAIRSMLPNASHKNLLVGLDPADDSAVYQITDNLAIVQSIDFFTPIVDDPFTFGEIAATNAISDIYAMGAKPLFALNVLAFSIEKLGREALAEILRGGAAAAERCGVTIAGGHSIDDPEPKYGMAVTGIAHPDEIITKSGGQAGDILHLSKPIGGGLITTAAKKGIATDEQLRACIEVMLEPNKDAATAALKHEAHALTDVTGFGLLGHLHELTLSSGLSAEICVDSVPVIPAVRDLARDDRCQSGGSKRNETAATKYTSGLAELTPEHRIMLTDAMTSGGLLSALPPSAPTTQALGPAIGRLTQVDPGTIYLKPHLT